MNHDIVFAPGITMRSLVHGARRSVTDHVDEPTDEQRAPEAAQENADAE